MSRLAAGDGSALAELVERYQGLLWSVAYRLTGNRDRAADLVQDVFLSLLENAGSYRPISRFPPYMLRILTNRFISSQRKSREHTFQSMKDSDELVDPNADSTSLVREASTKSALLTLPERQRLALVLRYYEQYSYEEIAACLDTSVKGVERLLARGRESLAKVLT